MSPADSACEKHFQDTHSLDSSRRYAVGQPFKLSVSAFSGSFSVAKQTFLRLEKKFRFNSKLRECYDALMNEYIELAHMTKIGSE